MLHNGVQLQSLLGPTPLVCALHEDHLYFYEGRARKKLQCWGSKPGAPKLRREHKSSATTPSANEWRPWEDVVEPGHYSTTEESMGQVRAWFLASGRSPRVILKDAGSVKTLMYTCTARD